MLHEQVLLKAYSSKPAGWLGPVTALPELRYTNSTQMCQNVLRIWLPCKMGFLNTGTSLSKYAPFMTTAVLGTYDWKQQTQLPWGEPHIDRWDAGSAEAIAPHRGKRWNRGYHLRAHRPPVGLRAVCSRPVLIETAGVSGTDHQDRFI